MIFWKNYGIYQRLQYLIWHLFKASFAVIVMNFLIPVDTIFPPRFLPKLQSKSFFQCTPEIQLLCYVMLENGYENTLFNSRQISQNPPPPPRLKGDLSQGIEMPSVLPLWQLNITDGGHTESYWKYWVVCNRKQWVGLHGGQETNLVASLDHIVRHNSITTGVTA